MSAHLISLAGEAKKASKLLRRVTTEQKNEALGLMADQLAATKNEILEANRLDVEQARQNGLSEALLDRLSLEKGRFENALADLKRIVLLTDPVGEILETSILDNGLKLSKKRVPLGVLCVIYESRPNVTIDVATLAVKTGNAVILRGGKETRRTNVRIVEALQKGLERSCLPSSTIQFLSSADREELKHLLKLDQYIDIVIPRGGEGLHRFCVENSTIPVITGGAGVCHLYVDREADLEKSIDVVVNAKTQRPSVCNALDTLLVHRSVATLFLPRLISKLQSFSVSFRFDTKAWQLLALKPSESFQEASENDWTREWLSLVLGIKIVDSPDEAIEHIQKYSTGHSDGILTNCATTANAFVDAIDSAAVYINASTRFTDGGEFGLGAEVAISTQKLHARGPMGLKELTTYKWIIEGNYQVRS